MDWHPTDEQIIAQINTYHRVIGSAPIQSYMPATREKAIEHWRNMGQAERDCAAALSWLVGLKDERPADYAEQKPFAWAAARAALAGLLPAPQQEGERG